MSDKVLIVEDDLGIRETLSDLIEFLGFECGEAGNGEEALVILKQIRPDLILTDLMMPIMDGIALLRILKQTPEYCAIPVIIITANADVESRLESYKYGADSCLVKPFNMTELAYQISSLIALRKNLIKKEVVSLSKVEDHFLQYFNNALNECIHFTSLYEVARVMNMSTLELQNKLKRFSDKSFEEYVRIFKLTKSKALIDSGKCNIKEAVDRCGFESLEYFLKAFKAYFGHSPS